MKPRWLSLIACPACRATLAEPCRTATGKAREAHSCRLLVRRCGQCGGLPEKGSHYCSDACRVSARRESYRRREIRMPTRLRRKARVEVEDVAA